MVRQNSKDWSNYLYPDENRELSRLTLKRREIAAAILKLKRRAAMRAQRANSGT